MDYASSINIYYKSVCQVNLEKDCDKKCGLQVSELALKDNGWLVKVHY